MKEDIEAFKQKNGNVTYTVKELLYGINNKLDNITEKLNDGTEKFAKLETTQSFHKKILFGIIGTIIAFIGGKLKGFW